MSDKFLTRQQAAERLAVDVQVLDRVIKAKKLKSVKIGRLVRIPEDALREFIEQGGAVVNA